MMTPLDQAHQTALNTAAHAEYIVAAIEAAGITIECNNLVGWQSSNAPAAQAIIDNPDAPLPFAQAGVVAAVGAQAASVIAAGFPYEGAIYQIDSASRQNIAAMGSLANVAGVSWPPGFGWITAANTVTPMSAAQMVAFAAASAVYYSGIAMNARALKDAALAATTSAQLASVSVAGGWPAGS